MREDNVKKRFLSNYRSANQVSYVAVRQCLEILINEFLIKNVGNVLNIFLIEYLLPWIYFGLWLVAVDIFWLSVGGGG